MSAADWLTSDAVTEALARIKQENEREWVSCPHCGADLDAAYVGEELFCPRLGRRFVLAPPAAHPGRLPG